MYVCSLWPEKKFQMIGNRVNEAVNLDGNTKGSVGDST